MKSSAVVYKSVQDYDMESEYNYKDLKDISLGAAASMHITQNNISADKVKTFQLSPRNLIKNFQFCFETPVTMTKNFWHGAIATIKETNDDHGDYVLGMVWELSLDDLPNLDRQECYYKAIQVPIIMSDGSQVTCRTYQMNQKSTGNCLPDPYYKKVIISGAKQNGLPEEYISFLESFEDTKDMTIPQGYHKVLNVLKELSGKEDLEY